MRGGFKKLPYRGLLIRFKVVDAKHSVDITRTKEDAALGRRTDPEACMDTQCAMRQSDVFPHKVLAVWFFVRTVYVLKSFNSNTNGGIVVRYLHANGKDIDKFDRNEPLPTDKRIHLAAPHTTSRIGARPGRAPGRHGDHKTKRVRPFVPRGVLRRAMTLREYESNKHPNAMAYMPDMNATAVRRTFGARA